VRPNIALIFVVHSEIKIVEHGVGNFIMLDEIEKASSTSTYIYTQDHYTFILIELPYFFIRSSLLLTASSAGRAYMKENDVPFKIIKSIFISVYIG
jgi:hypothetical protein